MYTENIHKYVTAIGCVMFATGLWILSSHAVAVKMTVNNSEGTAIEWVILEWVQLFVLKVTVKQKWQTLHS